MAQAQRRAVMVCTIVNAKKATPERQMGINVALVEQGRIRKTLALAGVRLVMQVRMTTTLQ
jgi:hypothetical protein